MESLEFREVSLRYEGAKRGEEGTVALESMSLSLGSGEAIAIIGPSGCGKSSTLQMAAGLLRPTSGSVRIDGEEVIGPRQKTALILQDFGLLPWKTARKNAELGLKVRGVDRETRAAKAREALKLVDLQDFENSYPGEMSGGMQQRLALARSLALDVDLLLMDEPLSALDALLREQLQETLLSLWRTKRYAQILVTHSIEEAVFLGQKIYVLSARPGHVVGVIDNEHMGHTEFRGSEEYYTLCNQIRSMLRNANASDSRQPEVAAHA